MTSAKQDLSIERLKQAIFELEGEAAGADKEMVLLKYNPKEYYWIRMSEDCASSLS